MQPRRQFLIASAAAFVAGLAPHAFAQEVLKQATIVVGYPPGGGTDILARLIADGLRGSYASAVVVENRPGAGGRIAAEYVKNAKNDGSVLLFTPAFPLLIYPHVYRNLPYDTLRDFAPVGLGGRSMLALSIGPAIPAQVASVAQFIEWCKANPTRAVFGAPSGSSQHFAGAMFARGAGIRLEHVPYKGGAPAIQDLLGGHIPANVSPVSEALPHHQAGKIRIIATTGAARSRFLPEVPTMAEFGYKDVIFQDGIGMFAPAGTPAGVVARLNAAMASAMKSEQGLSGLAKMGMELDNISPETYAASVKVDFERYRRIVQATGFKADD